MILRWTITSTKLNPFPEVLATNNNIHHRSNKWQSLSVQFIASHLKSPHSNPSHFIPIVPNKIRREFHFKHTISTAFLLSTQIILRFALQQQHPSRRQSRAFIVVVFYIFPPDIKYLLQLRQNVLRCSRCLLAGGLLICLIIIIIIIPLVVGYLPSTLKNHFFLPPPLPMTILSKTYKRNDLADCKLYARVPKSRSHHPSTCSTHRLPLEWVAFVTSFYLYSNSKTNTHTYTYQLTLPQITEYYTYYKARSPPHQDDATIITFVHLN